VIEKVYQQEWVKSLGLVSLLEGRLSKQCVVPKMRSSKSRVTTAVRFDTKLAS
jgi:hypothetical protein